MKNGHTFREPVWLKRAALALILLYITINAFGIGGYDVIFPLNSVLHAVLAGAVALSALREQRRLVDRPNRELWLGLSIGFLCWWIAETLWVALAILRWTVPYPSVADLFWLGGYLPMYAALRRRLRALPAVVPIRKLGFYILAFVFIAWAFIAVILPTVRSAAVAPQDLVTSVLDVVYVLADLILLLYAAWLLFVVQSGWYGRAWFWIALGLVLHSVAFLVYAYAFTRNLYYPGKLNWISTLGIDVPYSLSDVAILVGIYFTDRLAASFRPAIEVRTNLAPIPNTHILVFVAGDDTVMGVSRNYPGVYPGVDVRGKAISGVLGLSRDDEALVLQDIKHSGLMRERVFQADTPQGRREIRVSGIRIQTPQGEYGGATLLVRTFAEDFSLDQQLTLEQKGTVRYLLDKTGAGKVEEEEAKAFLLEWCRVHFAAFYDRVYQEGGGILAEAFLSEIRAALEAHGLSAEVQPEGLNMDGLSLTEVRRACVLVLETGRRFLKGLVGTESLDALMSQMHARLSPEVMRTAMHLLEQAEV